MAKKRLSRGGRGPRVREDELEQMVNLYLEGKSFKAIAGEVKRHWQTVKKYTVKALQEREGHELRREALKEALSGHFQDLVRALDSLSELLQLPIEVWQESSGGWQHSVPDRRNRLLLQALQDSHAKESPLWSWLDRWNQARGAYDRALAPLRNKVTGQLSKLHRLSLLEATFELTDDLTEMLLKRGVSMAQGFALYDPSMLTVSPSTDKKDKRGIEELWLAQSTRLAIGQNMAVLQERLSRIMETMGEWEEVQELARLFRQMAETRDMIEEEVEVLSLRRAFPGHCRLCPI
ncbi:MAG: hypothetical protein GH158_05565 [Dehalococcoidia bacterium]|nr:hypothetical protein [Dehalococcoidia bacterium]